MLPADCFLGTEYNADAQTRTHTHPYEQTSANSTPMITSEELGRQI
jgi:hypothetical protein